jgi:hypothetical protein
MIKHAHRISDHTKYANPLKTVALEVFLYFALKVEVVAKAFWLPTLTLTLKSIGAKIIYSNKWLF